MKKGKLVVLSAPSGTGKTTICKELLARNKKWKFSISATTRPKREDEIDGKDYVFMDIKKFESNERFGEFLEWEWVHGNRYGTPIAPIENALDNGNVMLLDIDVKGGMSVIEEFPDDCISIFIEPPGFNTADQLEVLNDRLQKRDNNSERLIKERLKRFELEMGYKENFKEHFINDDVMKTTDKIEKKIKESIK